ncbi:hypothetical protein Pcinc_019098 [Petrolisthes cinctipes]|uniref:Phospholipid/glycerol acyltransferase domain-containing protein n=1 Tax=Petrolisthes cinctipes TaxID=88211 RepID=A0AAE1FLW7_PETCI|nr:hypothetical protein Pcinc_019098 [Petrolisthes cinctipes]
MEGAVGHTALSEPSGQGKPTCQYIDLLAERRQSSDLRWAIREWKSVGDYKYGNHLTRKEIFDHVLQSDRVQHTISQLVEGGKDQEVLINEVEEILEQMGHTQDISVIRQFAFVLPKIMKRIYGKVMINEEGIEKLRSTLVETPVVLLPTHRSYADFLLVSYIAYHFNLPLPVIAAGMDFMSMAVIGDKLRGSGAFYIRRSFMDNTLYWAVFQEYVLTIVECTGAPLEFFLEGTRSRSGKSLPPKIGLLGCVSECWLRGRLPDLAIVPISISYERTLEEKLYAYELLGVPKPKESTSGLLKATSILKENYGDIYITVGDAVSVREFLEPLVDRHLSVATPSHLAPLSRPELSACESLGYHMLRKIQQGVVTSVWSVMCIHLQRVLSTGQWSLPFDTLVQETAWLIDLLKRIGAVISVEGGVKESVERCLEIHREVARLGEDGRVHIQRLYNHSLATTNGTKMSLKGTSLINAVTEQVLQHYINKVIHLLIRPALLSLALISLHTTTLEKLKSRFEFLRSLFGYDFIFEKNAEGRDFMEGLSVMMWCGEASLVQDHVHLVQGGGRFMKTLLNVLSPFVLAYFCTARTLASQEWVDNGELVAASQLAVENCLTPGSGRYSALSLDSIRHALRALTRMGAATRITGEDGKVRLKPVVQSVSSIVEVLGHLIRSQPLKHKL